MFFKGAFLGYFGRIFMVPVNRCDLGSSDGFLLASGWVGKIECGKGFQVVGLAVGWGTGEFSGCMVGQRFQN